MLYKMHRRHWVRGLQMGRECKGCSWEAVVQVGVVRRFGAVVCAASLAIMLALAKRLQKPLIQWLLM